MKQMCTFCRIRGGVGGRLVAILAVALPTAIARADGHYVLRDGTKLKLVRSETEFGVVFRSPQVAAAAKPRLLRSGVEGMEEIVGSSARSMRIVRVKEASAAERTKLRSDWAIAAVHALYRFEGVRTPLFSNGTVVVKLQPDKTAAERAQLFILYDVAEIEHVAGLDDVYHVRPLLGEDDDVRCAEKLADDEHTIWAHPNFSQPIYSRQVIPDDQFFINQWHLDNFGQFPGSVADADIDAVEAWQIATGSGVLLGMFDDSCDVTHEDLADNYLGFGQNVTVGLVDAAANDPSPVERSDTHGTQVMGLAVASANSVGVRGVAFGARFTATRAGADFAVSNLQTARAYTFAVETAVDVHINSWGFIGPFCEPVPNPPIIVDAIETAVRNGRDLDGDGGQDPLGMVIVFSAGNCGRENPAGFDLSTIPSVIGVGASDDTDRRAAFTNFGDETNFLAPGVSITTTDVEDAEEGEDKDAQGANVEGLFVDPISGLPFGIDIDPDGAYTGFFGGTSASCPIAAGVAALVLSVNNRITSSNVRLIMEHTCDKVRPDDALYNGITNRSFVYGYGRINARTAVEAAQASLGSGGITWPEAPANLTATGTTLTWDAGSGTDEFLVVESLVDFGFIPEDGVCYSATQSDCGGTTIALLPPEVTVLSFACTGGCAEGTAQSVNFTAPSAGTKFFAIYGRNSTGRYSFGVPIDSSGFGDGGGGGGTTPVEPPRPTIVTDPFPPRGLAPFTVQFNGNAVTDKDLVIDDSKTAWDFDTALGNLVDARDRSISHTYADPGSYIAKLTMVDSAGNVGSAEVQITVESPEVVGVEGGIGAGSITIVVGLPGTPGSDVSQGTSPFSVELRIESDTTGNVQSVVWDLGDGTQASGLVAPHTYINEGFDAIVLPVTVTVTTTSAAGTTFFTTASRLITVLPQPPTVDIPVGPLPGTGATQPTNGGSVGCGALGMVPILLTLLTLTGLRYRRR